MNTENMPESGPLKKVDKGVKEVAEAFLRTRDLLEELQIQAEKTTEELNIFFELVKEGLERDETGVVNSED